MDRSLQEEIESVFNKTAEIKYELDKLKEFHLSGTITGVNILLKKMHEYLVEKNIGA